MWRWFWPRERWRQLYHLSAIVELASLGVVMALPSTVGMGWPVAIVLLFAVWFVGPGWWLYRQAVHEPIEHRPDLPEGSGPEWPRIEGRLSSGEKAMLSEVFVPVVGRGPLRWLGHRARPKLVLLRDWVRSFGRRLTASIARLVTIAGPREFRERRDRDS